MSKNTGKFRAIGALQISFSKVEKGNTVKDGLPLVCPTV